MFLETQQTTFFATGMLRGDTYTSQWRAWVHVLRAPLAHWLTAQPYIIDSHCGDAYFVQAPWRSPRIRAGRCAWNTG